MHRPLHHWLLLITTLLLTPSASFTLDLPATLEVDILHPRPDTTANNNDTFPVVFALQSAAAAQSFRFTLLWRIYNENDTLRDSGSISNYDIQSKFRYVTKSTDTFYLIDGVIENRRLKPGDHTLTWEYVMSPCTRSVNTVTVHVATTVMGGNYTFTVVDDGSGEDFELPVGVDGEGNDDDCPVYANRTTVASVANTRCPVLGARSGDEQPCRARLENESQERCIRDFISGKNDTDACAEGFQIVDWDWPGELNETTRTDTGGGSSPTDDSESGGVSPRGFNGTGIVVLMGLGVLGALMLV